MAKHDDLERIHGEASYRIRTADVELYCTRRGGHMAPVRFNLGQDRWVEPYSLAPWTPDECEPGTPNILRVLRGDFFCLPFGENPDLPVHGAPANEAWEKTGIGDHQLQLRLVSTDPSAVITKSIRLVPGQLAVYQEHVVSNLEGAYNYGYHAIIEFPERGGPFYVNTAPFSFGSVYPDVMGNPDAGERSALKPGARFTNLAEVPLADGGTTSLNEYPARDGNEDLIMVSSADRNFGWTAVTLDGYVWVSLKNSAVLPSTLFWLSNGGRPQPPWNGVHRRRLGLEEVKSYFCDGLEKSRADLLRGEGVATAHEFDKEERTVIRAVHVVAPAPADFGLITAVDRLDQDAVAIRNARGHELIAAVDWQYLFN
jgi:hypothetical protein